jgi:hypothetical protein
MYDVIVAVIVIAVVVARFLIDDMLDLALDLLFQARGEVVRWTMDSAVAVEATTRSFADEYMGVCQ